MTGTSPGPRVSRRDGDAARASPGRMKSTDLPQPLGFYHVLTDGDALHFGYWPEGEADLTLGEAQDAHSELIWQRLPPAPARVLDVGCGLGAMAGRLAAAGYEVVAIAPSQALIAYAREHFPGPTYIACGFLDEHTNLAPPERYDAILFQESLQYFPDLAPVFSRVKALLEPEHGRVVMCDEVSYDPVTHEGSAVHEARDIEGRAAEAGFYVKHNRRMGPGVAPTCDKILGGFEHKRTELIARFGNESRALMDENIAAWKRLREWYRDGIFGYELWELRPSRFAVRGYRPGDERQILDLFPEVFGVHRDLAHWRWEYAANPFGGPFVSMAWDGEALAAHYAAYPVPVWLGEHRTMTYQVGDTLTHPAYRGIGRGNTSLLGRVIRHFHRSYCEGVVPFFYGFNTDRIQRLGRQFFGYHPVAPVQEWWLPQELPRALRSTTGYRLRGYGVTVTATVGDWADTVFEQARDAYGWLIVRDREYLRWRYERRPDRDYHFFVVYRRGRPLGWWLGYVEEHTLWLGDALFRRDAGDAPAAGLAIALKWLERQGRTIQHVGGWFAQTPTWWVDTLSSLGFRPRRQEQELDLCVTPFRDDIDPEVIARNMYFTYGDSDLF